jgi:hypothetical protein
MKVNFKKIITAIAATAMCAVPMAGSLSANAANTDEIRRGIAIESAAEIRLAGTGMKVSEIKGSSPSMGNRIPSGSLTAFYDPDCPPLGGGGPDCGPIRHWPGDDDDDIIIVIVRGPAPGVLKALAFLKNSADFRA